MEDKDSKNSRQIILEAAMEAFAEKGFDGSRVDEIARRAKVNKALIYYYFESKDKILEELMANFVNEIVNFTEMNVEQDKLDIKHFFDNSIIVDSYTAQLFNFIKKHHLLIKIIMSESLKENTSKNVFFQMLTLLLQVGMERAKQMNCKISDLMEKNIAGVFFSFIPMLNFIQFGESWAEYNQIDYQIVQDEYFRFFRKIRNELLNGSDS